MSRSVGRADNLKKLRLSIQKKHEDPEEQANLLNNNSKDKESIRGSRRSAYKKPTNSLMNAKVLSRKDMKNNFRSKFSLTLTPEPHLE